MRIQSKGIVSSNPACVTIEIPQVRKATENHPTESTSLEKIQSPISYSAKLEIEYDLQAHCFLNVKLFCLFILNPFTDQFVNSLIRNSRKFVKELESI